MKAVAGIVSAGALVLSVGVPSASASTQASSSAFRSSAPALAHGASAAVKIAQSRAAQSGEPVVVESLTTPTEITTALPDGSMQLEVSSLPVRVDQVGEWVPVDTTLALAGEWYEPIASAAPVRFSPGGSDALAQVQTESGEWITETWPYGVLPAPSVDGDTATYVEVLPGVDLKMVATKTGQASIYVVKSEKAAHSAKLDDLHVRIDGADLTKKSNGAVEAQADDGTDIVAGQPLWWDSSDGGTYREPGEQGAPAPVTHVVEADRVAMDVGDSVAKEEKRTKDGVTYPIYVDPDWSTGISASWYTDVAYPNQSYLSAGVSDVLRMGRYGSYRGNAFFEFPIGALNGKMVTDARLNTTQMNWAACPNNPVQVRTFGPQAAGFTWNQQNHGLWGGVLDTKNPGYCGSGPEAVGFNVTAGVQSKVGQSSIQLGLAPQDESANSRRHFSRAATLIVTYNTRPDVPTDPVFISPNTQCGTASAPTLIGQKDVTVRVNQTDPDGGNVDTNFHLMKASNLGVAIQSKAPGLGAQGWKSVTFTNIADGAYAWRAWGSDWIHDGVGPSAWCYFTVDTIGPALPGISLPSGTKTVGRATTATFSVLPADDVAFIAYAVVEGAPTDGFVFDVLSNVTCGAKYGKVKILCATNGVYSATFAPTSGVSTIWAVSYDRAGNPSAAPGTTAGEAGKHGAGVAVQSVNDSRVSYASGGVWRTLNQPTPLGSSIPHVNPNYPAWTLELGADTLRTLTANPQAPSVPIPKPVLGFADPATTGLTGPEFTGTVNNRITAMGSLTVASWVSPGISGGQTAVSVGSAGLSRPNASLRATADKWQFCVDGSALNRCVSADRPANAGWTHLAGIIDDANSEVRLYVDGALVASGPLGTYFTHSGYVGLKVGVSVASGAVADRWTGQVADPAFFNGVATPSQLIALRAGQDPANG